MAELESLLGRLIAHRVDFVVVGGFAAVAHGVTLVTQDIDVCVDLSWDNLVRLHEAVNDLEPVHRMTPGKLPFVLTQEMAQGLKNLYLGTRWGQVDCLGEVKGLGAFGEVAGHSVEIELPVGRCRVLGIDGLIRSKEAMGRPQDKLAVLQLRAIKERGL